MTLLGGLHYEEQVCGEEMGEKKGSDSCSLERSETEATKMMRNLIRVSCTAIWSHVMVWACVGAKGHV